MKSELNFELEYQPKVGDRIRIIALEDGYGYDEAYGGLYEVGDEFILSDMDIYGDLDDVYTVFNNNDYNSNLEYMRANFEPIYLYKREFIVLNKAKAIIE